jgi:lipopolysaccharide/colanic/teichoic acid biosynthesis glycosyltransferase
MAGHGYGGRGLKFAIGDAGLINGSQLTSDRAGSTGTGQDRDRGREPIRYSVLLAVKRTIDVVGSLMLLIALAPLLLGIALAVKLTSPGLVFYRQERFGQGGRVFQILKFRTMHQRDCDSTAALQTSRGDSRITAIGKSLRARDLDELPQLFNVLKGDMSLVGPRPHPIRMRVGAENYEDIVPGYHERHVIKPGITGMAQIRGFRGPVETRVHAQGRQQLDVEYVRRMSLLIDISILLRTVAREFWISDENGEPSVTLDSPRALPDSIATMKARWPGSRAAL